jgi:hypothetical protein
MHAGKFPTNFIDEAEGITKVSYDEHLRVDPRQSLCGCIEALRGWKRRVGTRVLDSEVVNLLLSRA